MSGDPDVIVVGAGPAGSATALLLARAGVRVLLLDRAAFPRAKPCGDCLSAGASAVLERLALLDRIRALPCAHLAGWSIIAPSGAALTASFPGARDDSGVGHALAVERSVFDAALLEAATDAGCVFRPGVHVHDVIRDGTIVRGVATGHGTITARTVVGADGLRSVLARRLGAVRRGPRLRKVSLTWHVHAPDLCGSYGEMHIGAGIVCGIAPVDAAGRCNITIVADADRFGRAIAADAAGFAATALASLPRLRDRMRGLALDGGPPLASGPFDRPVRRVVFDGAALVGDAAGYYDPFTGQGIHQALCSAELLAPVLARALERGAVTTDALREYATGRRALVRCSRQLQMIVEFVTSRPTLTDSAIPRIERARPFANTLIAATGDLVPPLRLLSPRSLLSLIAPVTLTETPA